MPSLSELAIEYIDRVVNRRDISALDEMVSHDYRGSGPGWPTTVEELRQFYLSQFVQRRNWHIDVQEVVELGDSVVIRAHAYGTAVEGQDSVFAAVDWLAHYRFRQTKIVEINLLSLVREAGPPLAVDMDGNRS